MTKPRDLTKALRKAERRLSSPGQLGREERSEIAILIAFTIKALIYKEPSND